jgi:hypothetical protein
MPGAENALRSRQQDPLQRIRFDSFKNWNRKFKCCHQNNMNKAAMATWKKMSIASAMTVGQIE